MLWDDTFPSFDTPPSPNHHPTEFPSVPQPTFLNDNNLDDVFGFCSPSTTSENLTADINLLHNEPSDMSRLRSQHRTSGYREGLSSAKNTTIQEGFDEGYGLGAVMGLEVGTILGLLEGIYASVLKLGKDEHLEKDRIRSLLEKARRDLRTEEVFSRQWWGDDGTWRYEVAGEDGEVTFKEVVSAHPTIQKWKELVNDEVKRWRLDLSVMERVEAWREKDEVKEVIKG